MPPRYLRKGTTKLKACSEFTVEACDLAPADQCCGALPCTLCLELETYADGISYGTATFGGSSWTGTVGGLAFVSYWERNYLTDDCEYVVTLDGEEVYRATCYEGASCRDPGGSVGVLIGYDEGTLTWTKHEPRPLAVTTDPDTGCNDFFCGTCRCTCDCLCVTITEPDGNAIFGEICSTSYPCDAPIWEGSIGYYDLSIALGRDQYTAECTISLTASGEEVDPVAVTGCADMSASVELYDGTVIAVACKQCSCDVAECDVCECEFSTPLACVRGDLTSTGDPCAGGVVSGGSSSVPSGKEAWVVGEDTAIPWQFDGFNITIPCGLLPLNLVCVLVRRAQLPSGPSPHVDNNIVQPCEYYFVVYDVDFNVTFIGYEYELCCGRSVAAPTCQTRLSWIRFVNVSAGRGTYSFLWWSHSGTGFYPDGFQGNGVLEGECPFSDGDNPCS
jgi:hypothetical protein